MKTQLIAALLMSGAVVVTPAFAGNNASNAPFTSFATASANPDTGAKSRAEVRAELVSAVQEKSMAPQGDRVDPSYAAIARQVPAARASGIGLMDRERP
jgi:hypothetical protein